MKLLLIIFISILIETFVFNAKSFRMLFGDYEYRNIEISNEIINGLEKVPNTENEYKVIKDNPCITINDIDMNTGTIKVDLLNEKRVKLDICIEYTDSSSKYYRELPIKTINQYKDTSKYTSLHLSGKTNSLKINIIAKNGEIIRINSISLNEQIPVEFRKERYIALALIIGALYYLLHSKKLNEVYSENDRTHVGILTLVIISVLLLITSFNNLSTSNKKIVSNIKQTDSIEYEKHYTDAIIDGHFYLDVIPDRKLTEVENPYDISIRNKENINYLYDFAYYKGKYYVYFTVLPQLLINVPFKLLTGKYINIAYEILLFSILGTMFGIVSIMYIIKKYFPNTKLKTLIWIILTVSFSSMILYLNGRTYVYELAGSCGYWLIMQAVYFTIKAFYKEKISIKSLVMSAISAALAVCARPNLIIISLLFIFIYVYEVIERIRENNEYKKYIVKYVLAIFIPYTIIGILTMIFNYIRFENIFEFGAKYQLTGMDFSHLGIKPSTIPIGLFHYLFNLPIFDFTFPFIHCKAAMPLYFGEYGAPFMGLGVFWMAPISAILLFIPVLKNEIKEKNKKIWHYMLVSLTVALLMIIAITLVAMSYQRYMADFAWLIVWPAIIVVLFIKERINDDLINKMFSVVICISTIICIFAVSSMSIKGEWNKIEENTPKIYYRIEEDFEFWK